MTDDEILAKLQADMQAQHAAGRSIDLSSLGIEPEGTVYVELQKNCSVCAMGAALLGHAVGNDIFTDFAKLMGRSSIWAVGFYNGSTEKGLTQEYYTDDQRQNDHDQGYALARKMVAWVNRQKGAGKL